MVLPRYFVTMQSLNESQIPDSLLERLVVGMREFPPVCAVIGGILGQVLFLLNLLHSVAILMYE